MNVEDEVLQTFNDIRDALCKPDPETLRSLIAEDYRGFDLGGGVERRSTILDFYKPGGAVLDVFEVDGIEVHVFGEVGIVTGSGRIAGRYGGDIFDHRMRFCDIYVQRGSKWLLFFTQGTEVRVSKDA